MPKSVRGSGAFHQTYLDDRPQLALALCLIDMRRDPGGGLIAWFQERELPVLIVATKSDKVAKSKRLSRVTKIAKACGVSPKSVLQFSALKGDGKDLLWQRLLSTAHRYSEPADQGEGEPSA